MLNYYRNTTIVISGITLIALVVTIVVLLILAGITISLVFGQNGVIKKAQDSKEQTAIGEMREKLEMAKVPVYADGNGSYNVQDYWDRIESEGLITDQEVDKIDNGDGTYEVTTTPGYVFEITVEPNEEIADNIIIGECIGKGENLNIGLRVVNKTTNSIEIEVVRAEGASNFKYSIKKQGEEYGEAEESEATTNTFSGLTQGGIYTIKVEAIKDGEQQEVERTVQIGEIPKAIYGEVTWTGNGQATVRIYTEEDGYQLEWQKNGISEGNWTREDTGVKEKTITGLANGDTIYARLYDGVSSGKYANIEVADEIKPVINSFEAIETTSNSVKVQVNSTDNESGLANTNTYKFYLDDEKTAKGTNTDGVYTYEKLKGLTNYKLRVEVYDNAGNKEERSINVTTNEPTADEVLDITGNKKIYVEIPNIKKPGETILCNVLYNDETNGLQIISVDSVENVTLGNSNFTTMMNSYNNAITTLNGKAKEYIDEENENYALIKDIVKEARCVGSNPTNPSAEAGYLYVISKYQLRDADENYSSDYNKMTALGISGSNTTYWLASRYVYSNSLASDFGVRSVNSSGGLEVNRLCTVNFSDSVYACSESYGFRPVFHLKSGIKITGGDGKTAATAYTLGL